MDCIFCEIAGGNAGAEVLYEDEDVISILDIRPLNLGHALVLPKKHFDNMLQLPGEELIHLSLVSQKIAKKIVKVFNPDGFNIIVNTGEAAGQSVFHFHYHIIPRYREDKITFNVKFKSYGKGEMKEIAEKIKNA